MKTHFILYVADQALSTEFYSAVLNVQPTLNVPGMTEFAIGEETVLGLMPEAGAVRLLGEKITAPIPAENSPRAEIYLIVDEPDALHERALAAGARELSPLQLRDWGHEAAYSLDPDGYLLAFAREITGAE